MRYYHEKVAHAGRRIIINELRSQGYYIINCTSTGKSMISKFVDRRQFRRKVCQEKVGDLPSDRLTQEPTFLPIAVSTFLGHFCLKIVVNKENIMVQCLHVCPAELCILKLQAPYILVALY